MSLAQFMHRMFLRFFGGEQQNAVGVCTPDELQQALRRERSRADRTGGCFSIACFSSAEGNDDRQALQALVAHLKQRSRSIDNLGWNENGELWLILADCSEYAARQLAAELCARFSIERPLKFTTYHYASNSIPSGTNRNGLQASNPPTETQDPSAQPVSQPSGFDDHQPLERVAAEPECVHAMTALFEQHMPWWKRSLDIVISASALIVLLPLFAIIAVAIKWNSPGPVLFKQGRSGRGGRPFLLYKFRSMSADAESLKVKLLAQNEQDGPAFKMEHDPRVTAVGRVLRAFSLDELPQLWNILRGEMSLVGPRPLPINEANACTGWQRQRNDVTPGLTCIWQVKDRRAKIPFVDWVRMDIHYIKRHSIVMDLRLLLETLLFVIRRKGV